MRNGKLQLGSLALLSQAAPARAVVAAFTDPGQLVRGVEVWIWFRAWRRGRIARVIAVNPRLVRIGRPRGDRAVVMLESVRGDISVRRPLAELLPTALVPDAPYMPVGLNNRQLAREIAAEWWARRSGLDV